MTELSMEANLPRGFRLILKRTLFQIIYCKRLSLFELCLLLLLLNAMASRFYVSNFLPALTGTKASQVQTVRFSLVLGPEARPAVRRFFAPHLIADHNTNLDSRTRDCLSRTSDARGGGC